MMRIKDLFPDASGSGRVLVLGELLLDFVPCDSDMRLSQPGTVLKTVSGSSSARHCAAPCADWDQRITEHRSALPARLRGSSSDAYCRSAQAAFPAGAGSTRRQRLHSLL